ncbi:hypothetical protein PoB_005493000 [Plakobranchus ocellatus]|uniref:Aurora-A binding domain-containing protein n=1 Tax=Plakobranchus ocellatus TaxID=259542 RepID=A0AAV4CAI1_9GAST|nr:hypothetical protein PoB_005493000 [Plakobranchus ocellatus]
MELNYEFDAPKFVDFLQLAETDDGSDTDAWFDERTEDDYHFFRKTQGLLLPMKNLQGFELPILQGA